MQNFQDRNLIVAKFMSDLERLKADFDEIVKSSRAWPVDSKVQAGIANIRRDMATLHAHSMVVFREFVHMNSVREQLALSSGAKRPGPSKPAPAAMAEQAAAEEEMLPDEHAPLHTGTAAPVGEAEEVIRIDGISAEDFVMPAPPKPEASTERISKSVDGLPPELLRKLKEQGL